MNFHHDADEEYNYPVHGSLEEKARHGLEMVRRSYFWNKKVYETQKEGGRRHAAVLQAFGPKTAKLMADNSEQNYKSFLANAFLDDEGNTTDPKYPVDKMINHELRRIRQAIILSVSNFMFFFEEMMPEETQDWSRSMIRYCLEPYQYRYMLDVFDDINVVIPKKKMKARTTYEVCAKLLELSEKYNGDRNRHDPKAIVTQRIRDELTDFLLVDIPLTNYRLNETDRLSDIRKETGKLIEQVVDSTVEKQAAAGGEKKDDDEPILH